MNINIDRYNKFYASIAIMLRDPCHNNGVALLFL